MSKPQRIPTPEIKEWRLRAKLKLFRVSGNTGGKIVVGIGYTGASNGGTSSAGDNAIINVADYTIGFWNDIEIYFKPTSYAFGPVAGLLEISNTSPITGADVWLADFHVEEVQDSPNVPQVVAASGYTLKLGDQGKHIYISAGGVTVPPNSTVAFPIEAIVTIVNNSGSNQTISQGSGVTLRLAGTATTGNRTLAQYGVATLLKVATDTWIVSGAGVT